MKMHYFGQRAGRAFCGTPVTAEHLATKVSEVTCKLCLRHIAGPLRKPVADRKEGKPRASDTLMRRVFKNYEGGLRVRLDALKLALAASRYSDQHNAESKLHELSIEADALIEYLEGREH